MGELPVRYLGVPLITSRLRHSDCRPLLERILSRIRLWTSASLTYAGRLQLIKSVLFSIQVYWSSMFLLPQATARRIESFLAAFLWKGTSLSHSGAKVAWASLCYPLKEGGLGIKRIQDWNRAAILKHIWRLLTDQSSIWSSWVRSVEGSLFLAYPSYFWGFVVLEKDSAQPGLVSGSYCHMHW